MNSDMKQPQVQQHTKQEREDEHSQRSHRHLLTKEKGHVTLDTSRAEATRQSTLIPPSFVLLRWTRPLAEHSLISNKSAFKRGVFPVNDQPDDRY